ncbi:hypothetical protein [Actinoplanes philippinensis]|uniref:hypothetical protein n=1 Tax=Actinoplanes philippinensis TaxID=35752 RepID=UPI0033E1BEBC
MRTALAKIMVAAAVVGCGVLAVSSPASAAIGGCHQDYNELHTGAYLVCYTGSGQYQVRVTCDNENPFGRDYYRYGAWVPVTQTSTAACSNGDYAYNLYTRLLTDL